MAQCILLFMVFQVTKPHLMLLSQVYMCRKISSVPCIGSLWSGILRHQEGSFSAFLKVGRRTCARTIGGTIYRWESILATGSCPYTVKVMVFFFLFIYFLFCFVLVLDPGVFWVEICSKSIKILANTCNELVSAFSLPFCLYFVIICGPAVTVLYK